MQVSNTFRVSYSVPQKQIFGDLKTYLAIEMNQNNAPNSKYSGVKQIAAEIMQTYDLLKFAIARSNSSNFSL